MKNSKVINTKDIKLSWFYKKIGYKFDPIINLFNNIKNFLKWVPTAWGDRNFDEYFLHRVIRFKLKNMAEYFESTIQPSDDQVFVYSEGFHNPKHKIEKINTILKLFDLIENDYYIMEAYDKIIEIYGDRSIDFVKNENDLGYKVVDVWERDYSEEELEKIKKHEDELVLEAEYKTNKASQLIWKMISNYNEYWWD